MRFIYFCIKPIILNFVINVNLLSSYSKIISNLFFNSVPLSIMCNAVDQVMGTHILGTNVSRPTYG